VVKAAQIGLGAIGSIYAEQLLKAGVELAARAVGPRAHRLAARHRRLEVVDATGDGGRLARHGGHLGPAGTGAKVKLISNYISGLHNLVAAEAFALGRAAGLSIDTMLDAFAQTDAGSYWLFNYFAPRIRSGDMEPGFSVDLQHKDLRLCEDLARLHKVPMPLNGLALQIYQMLRGSGRGGKDLVEAANLVAELSGLPRYGETRTPL
jgi:3-hydroxyisobutyrate dehydrogenase-like beta-hydroxyacid dehydrogenase